MPGPSSPCKANVNGRRQKMAVDNALMLTNKMAIEEGQPGSSSSGIPEKSLSRQEKSFNGSGVPGKQPKSSERGDARGRLLLNAHFLRTIMALLCGIPREEKKKEKSEGR